MIIYKIQNKINGKIYIGQTVRNLSNRIAAHIKGNRTYIQRALNKYGIGSFIISTIDSADTKEIIDEKEKYWIKKLNCKNPNGYNLTDGGEGSNGYIHSEGVKKKMRKPRSEEARRNMMKSEETKRKIRDGNIGKKCSVESKMKMSIAQKGRKTSEETRKKLSESHKGNTATKGHILSEEHKKRISDSLMGKMAGSKNGMFGKKHSAETRQKISNGNKGKKMPACAIQMLSERNKGNIYFLGGKHSEETKKKMSNARKLWHQKKINAHVSVA